MSALTSCFSMDKSLFIPFVPDALFLYPLKTIELAVNYFCKKTPS